MISSRKPRKPTITLRPSAAVRLRPIGHAGSAYSPFIHGGGGPGGFPTPWRYFSRVSRVAGRRRSNIYRARPALTTSKRSPLEQAGFCTETKFAFRPWRSALLPRSVAKSRSRSRRLPDLSVGVPSSRFAAGFFPIQQTGPNFHAPVRVHCRPLLSLSGRGSCTHTRRCAVQESSRRESETRASAYGSLARVSTASTCGSSGDLYVQIHLKAHPLFPREAERSAVVKCRSALRPPLSVRY